MAEYIVSNTSCATERVINSWNKREDGGIGR